MHHKILIAIFALLYGIIAPAQTIVSTSEYDATPSGIISNNSGSMLEMDYTHSFKRAVSHPNPNEAVMLLKKRKQEGGNLIKINNKGKIIWDIILKDAVLFTGLYDNKIIVLIVPDWNDNNVNTSTIKSIKVTLIDVSKGTATAEKILWQGEPEVYIDPKVLSLKDGTFKGLLLRYTTANKKKFSNPVKEYAEKAHSSKVDWLSYQTSLDQPITKTISSNSLSDEFLGCDVNSKGELFIISCTNSAISAEKYAIGASAPVNKSVIYYEAHEEARKRGVVSCNATSDQHVAVAMRYRNPDKDYSIITANFDMATGKGYSYVTELNKDYRKQLNLRRADDLQVHDMFFYKDKIVVAKEIETIVLSGSSNAASRFYHFETLLSVYDNQMKLQKDIVVPRSLELFVVAQMNGGYHLDKNVLTMLANETGRGPRITTKIATVDLDLLTVTANNTLDRGTIDKAALMEAEASCWFNNTIVLSYVTEHGIGGRNERTTFQVVKL